MPRSGDRGPTDSGIEVYPKLPVPKRHSEPGLAGAGRGAPRRLGGRRIVAAAVAGLVAGAVLGFVARPRVASDPRVDELEAEIADATAKADGERRRAADLTQQLAEVTAARQHAERALTGARGAEATLATAAADRERQLRDAKIVRDKLAAAAGKALPAPVVEGDRVRLVLPERALFAGSDDRLGARGKQLLARLALALRELGDHQQIWIAGHTDDRPIPLPKQPATPPAAPAKRPTRGRPATPPPPPPPVVAPRFATNWELSAARALAVIHYLQDVAKLDPTRIAAQAFGQYRPASKNRAKNRRLELVIAPR